MDWLLFWLAMGGAPAPTVPKQPPQPTQQQALPLDSRYQPWGGRNRASEPASRYQPWAGLPRNDGSAPQPQPNGSNGGKP